MIKLLPNQKTPFMKFNHNTSFLSLNDNLLVNIDNNTFKETFYL